MLLRLMFAVLIWAGLGAAARAEELPDQRPVLRIEPGMHTAMIKRIGVDAACRLMVTGSEDKTARLWALPEGGRGSPELLRTLRLPIGEGHEGKVYAVAMSPDGRWVAAGGWDASYAAGQYHSVYIFEAATGRLVTRLGRLGNVILHLAFSPDGSRLAATLGGGEGMRLWETAGWRLLAEDKDYGGKDSYGAAFGGGGRLFTVALDGQIRRYGANGRLEAKAAATGGREPVSIAVQGQGGKLAIGFAGSTAVEVYDAGTLKRLYAAGTNGIAGGSLGSVAWSADGARLYAGGYPLSGAVPVYVWQDEGRGKRSEMPLAQSTIMQLLPCGKGIAAGAADPAFGRIAADGARRVWQEGVTADMRGKRRDAFTLSADGRRVRFGLGQGGEQPVLFDLAAFRLTDAPEAVAGLAQPVTSDLAVSDWENNTAPELNGKPIALKNYERSRSLAIAPDNSRFVLGADWRLRAYRASGGELWQKPGPGIAWGVNISRDGRLAVAAYGDGTIRWFRLSDGQELLALFVHAKDRRFAAWTPKGYYAASPGAEDLIGWHVNRDWEHAADFFPASRFRDQFNRPDIVSRVLDDLDEDTAIAEANRLANVKFVVPEIRKIQPPVITILSPVEGAGVTGRTLTVTYSLRSPSGLPLKSVRALVDGRPVAGGVETKGFEQVKTEERTLSLTVEAPDRDFELSLIAEAEGAAPSEPSRVRLKWTGAPPAAATIKPKMYALLIGVSDYKDTNLRLRWAAKDAEDLARLLSQQKGGLYRDVEVRLVKDADATAARIVDELYWIESAASQGDRVFVFLAGHGVLDSINDYYYVPHDARMEMRGTFYLPTRSTSVSKAQIVASLKRTQGHALFFFDTCHSGNAAARGGQTLQPFIDELRDASNGVLALASSEGRQLSQEDNALKNGVFTRALLEGLGGAADTSPKDGVVTYDELGVYVAERVKALTQNTQNPVRDVVTPSRNLAVAAVR